ncbi:MAG TPA: ATP phosphoribosyltransferase [Saprospiraceae bacterium]|nr:ATP phosphoribosyltransferase [Saprospiraceae bacterium]
MKTHIKIAIQKSGRLSEDSRKLLKECGIVIQNGKNKLIAPAINFPAQILYLRDDDIPQYVEDGIADLGILGENVFLESQKEIQLSKRLGFSKCRLSLAVPKSEDYKDVKFFEGKKIATSYPIILSHFLKSKNVSAEIHKISGSVEIAPGIGLAAGICDIVSSGSTLFSNGLKEVEQVLKSEAVIVSNKNLNEHKQKILDKLLFRIDSVNKAKQYKYILLNAPNEALDKIANILPGMKSPTVLPLLEEGWSSVHSVIHEERFWEIIDQLKAAGAQGILVTAIEKMVM